ncbi:hypothetical protein G4B88_009625 [Cannabis sativa]|uniref:RNase H type-1 domain-containing protein n=1 Tax=Cannabis sativa TaxID=3483 RepID=A0A7J6FF55_CANSA|nr:hypothetical protein G4B88_009625 [Cannabis sativa]
MELNNVYYPVCGEEMETIFHLMWKCTLAKVIWFNSSMGIRVDRVDVNDWEQWKEWFLVDNNRSPNISFMEIIVTALCVVEAICDIACDEEGLVAPTVLRNDKGTIVIIKTERSQITDPLIGEALAVCMAAELMVERMIEHVVFQSDNMDVVKAFSTERLKGISILNWCNFMAHNIAKWAREAGVTGSTQCSELDHEVLNDYIEWKKHAG